MTRGLSEGIDALLAAVSTWAETQPDVWAVALVGSHARGKAKVASDVDLVLIADDPSKYLKDLDWARRLGPATRAERENYGKVTSLRVWYRDGLEVEFGFTDRSWLSLPLDEGTRSVLLDGARVLFERDQLLSAAVAAATTLAANEGPASLATNLSIDLHLRDAMFDYYNECAAEYENVYTVGADTASPLDPSVFVAEARLLSDIVRQFASGRLIDVACGTAYWLPHYALQCSSITLLDQSERMLDLCRKKTENLDLAARCAFVRGDVFEVEFPPGAFDCALVGFLLSHIAETQQPMLFDALRRLLAPSGRFLIMDSAFSPERARVNAKVERQSRRLSDGRRFEVFKRYCDRQDIDSWAGRYQASLSLEHFGTGFYAVAGTFERS